MEFFVGWDLIILSSKSFKLLCENRTSLASAALTPTNKELWINLSAITVLFLFAKVWIAAIFAWNPLGKSNTLSWSSHLASSVSNNLCIGLELGLLQVQDQYINY